MKDKLSNSVAEKFAFCATKIILNLDLHHILFFIIFFLSLIQFESTITWIPETSQVFWAEELRAMIGSDYYSQMTLIVRWFDLSIQIQQKLSLLYIILPLVSLASMGVFLVLIVNYRNSELQADSITHYLIKISFGLALVLSYGGLNIILRAFMYVLVQQSPGLKVLAGLCLILFIIFCYLIPLFGIDQVSWNSQRTLAVYSFPNPIMLYNAFRMAISFVLIGISQFHRNKEGNFQGLDNTIQIITLVTCILFLPVLIYLLLKQPIIAPNHNNIFRIFMAILSYLIFIRIMEIIFNSSTGIIITLFGAFLSVLAFRELANRKINSILIGQLQNQNEKGETVQKLKLLSYLVAKMSHKQHDPFRSLLDSFIVNHQRNCSYSSCPCVDIFNSREINEESNIDMFESKIIREKNIKSRRLSFFNDTHIKMGTITLEDLKIPKPQEKEQMKQNPTDRVSTYTLSKEKKCLFNFLNFLGQKNTSPFESLKHLSIRNKKQYIEEKKQIFFLLAYYEFQCLSKMYCSFQTLLCIHKELQQLDLLSFRLNINYLILKNRQGYKMSCFMKEIQSLYYGTKFFDLQDRIIKFRKRINQFINRSLELWKQLYGRDPDEKKVIWLIGELDRQLNKIKNVYENLCNKYQFSCNGRELKEGEVSYEQSWNGKVKSVIDQFYIPFLFAFGVSEHEKQGFIEKYQHKKPATKLEKLSKLMDIYDSDSKIALCLINIEYGQDFGKIVLANQQFSSLNGLKDPNQPLFLNDFLPKAWRVTHAKKMKAYLEMNKFQLPSLQGFIKVSEKIILEIDFFGVFHPAIFNGLRYAAFVQPAPAHPLTFQCSRQEGLIGVTKALDVSISEGTLPITYDDLEKLVASELLKKFRISKQPSIIQINGEEIYIRLFKKMETFENLQNSIHCFEILNQAVKQSEKEILKNPELDQFILSLGLNKIQSKVKRVSEQQDGADTEFNKLLIFVNSQKQTTKTIKCWKLVNIILFSLISIFILAIIIYLPQEKASLLHKLTKIGNSSEFLINLMDISFTIRRINVLGYEKSQGYSTQSNIYGKEGLDDQLTKIQVYQEALEIDLQEIEKQIKYVDFDWNQKVSGKDVKDSGIEESVVRFQLLKNKHIFASAAYLKSQSPQTLSFDYLFPEIPTPYSSQATNLYHNILNNNYILIPAIKSQFQITSSEQLQTIQDIVHSIIFYEVLGIYAVCILTVIYSIYINQKLRRLISLSYKLFESLKTDFINQKIITLQNYQEYILCQYSQKNQRYLIVGEEQIPEHTEQQKTMAHAINIALKKQRSSGQSIVDHTNSFTGRQLNISEMKTTRRYDKRNEYTQFQARPKSNVKRSCCLTISILPIVILGSTIILLENFYVSKVYTIYEISKAMEQKTHNLLMIRNMMNQLSIEYSEFISSNPSVKEQLNEAIDSVFPAQNQMNDLITTFDTPETYQAYQIIRFQKYCEILKIIPPLDRPLNIRTECSGFQLRNFNTRSNDQFTVYFTDQARILSRDANITNRNPQFRRQIRSNHRIFFFEQISANLYRGTIYLRQFLRKDYQSTLHQYQLVVMSFCGFFLVLTIVIAFLWIKKQLMKLCQQTSQVKTILQLVCLDRIKLDRELKQYIVKHYQQYKLLE